MALDQTDGTNLALGAAAALAAVGLVASVTGAAGSRCGCAPGRHGSASKSYGDVAGAWAAGRAAGARSMSTDGRDLHSYGLKIGETLPDGTKVLYDFTGPYAKSATTSKHVGAARSWADTVVLPQPRMGRSVPTSQVRHRGGVKLPEVAEAWCAGEGAHAGKDGIFRTNGRTLFSYQLLIGDTLADGTKVAYDYTGPNMQSKTTSRHVGYAKRCADRVEAPTGD